MIVNRGSEWRKWDLHFHTPSSYDYGNKSFTNQQLIDGLSLNQISVVAVTDHHIIDIPRIIELQKLGAIKDIAVLPGIEFLAEMRGVDPIHFIAIFPEDSNLSYIWKQIESNTEIKRIEGQGKAANEVYCDLLDTAKLVKELGGLITIHAGSKTNSIDNITHSLPHGLAQKTDIARVVDIFEMGKETDCQGYNEHVIPFLKKAVDKHIPLVICSDNHHIENYSSKQNLWIKASPTFEGLKQIIYEPEHRVKIQADQPNFKEERLLIDKLRFIGGDNKFSPNPIYLNENLNVIIGGKSSGKSILLYNIAKTLLADSEFFKKENIDNKYNLRTSDPSFNFEISTRGGFSQLMYRDALENSIIPEIKYIPQNYLVKLAEPEENKTGNALNKMIRDLINEDKASKDLYDNFISKVKANDRKREAIIDNYFEIKERIAQLDAQLKLKTNREILEKNILSNTSKVEELNKSTGMTSDQISSYNELQTKLEENKLSRTRATNDFKKITDFNSETLNTINSLKSKKQLLSNSLENSSLKGYFDSKYASIDTLITSITSIINDFELVKAENGSNVFKITSSVSQTFTEIGSENQKLEQALLPFLKNEEIKKQAEILLNSISEDKEALQSISQLTKEILDNKKALSEEKEKLFILYNENHQAYLDVVSKLKMRTVDLEKDGLKIDGRAAFNFPKFQKNVMDFSDGRTASYSSFPICNIKLDSLSDYQLPELIADLRAMFEGIVEKGDYALVGKANQKSCIKMLLEDYFFDFWQIEYKKDKLGKMSTGKASFVILMLIVGLSKSKAPILIDQPEDNLDNRSITTDLVEYLKNKKLERQIILVTHNANIVVNADAENVIIAHQKGQGDVETESAYQFEYINGPLEDTFAIIETEKDLLKSMGIREHIADIVEGGKAAFKKREEKYGFKSFR
jgi:hypothetical protein